MDFSFTIALRDRVVLKNEKLFLFRFMLNCFPLSNASTHQMSFYSLKRFSKKTSKTLVSLLTLVIELYFVLLNHQLLHQNCEIDPVFL